MALLQAGRDGVAGERAEIGHEVGEVHDRLTGGISLDRLLSLGGL